MNLNIVKCLPVLLIVAACSNEDKLAQIGDKTVTNAAFDAHLSFKRIDPTDTTRVEQEQERYLERQALVQAVVESEQLDEAAIQAELDEFRTQMIINRYLSDYLDNVVDETALNNYYNSNLSEFQIQQAHIAHIVIRTHNAMTQTEKQAAQQRARDAQAQLAKGQSFESLAEAISEDLQSGPRGGNLGWISEDAIDPAFSQVAFELEPGAVSDIVQTQYGYHLIKLIEPLRTQTLPYTQVKGDIRYRLRNQAKAAEEERLRSAIDITLYD